MIEKRAPHERRHVLESNKCMGARACVNYTSTTSWNGQFAILLFDMFDAVVDAVFFLLLLLLCRSTFVCKTDDGEWLHWFWSFGVFFSRNILSRFLVRNFDSIMYASWHMRSHILINYYPYTSCLVCTLAWSKLTLVSKQNHKPNKNIPFLGNPHSIIYTVHTFCLFEFSKFFVGLFLSLSFALVLYFSE